MDTRSVGSAQPIAPASCAETLDYFLHDIRPGDDLVLDCVGVYEYGDRASPLVFVRGDSGGYSLKNWRNPESTADFTPEAFGALAVITPVQANVLRAAVAEYAATGRFSAEEAEALSRAVDEALVRGTGDTSTGQPGGEAGTQDTVSLRVGSQQAGIENPAMVTLPRTRHIR